MKLIEPSLLSINKDKPKVDIYKLNDLGIKLAHYDVMDGKFVPNKSFTTEYLQDLKNLNIKASVHLMVVDPENWLEKYKNFNVEVITFHAETQSIEKAKEIINKIHSYGFKAGISVKPDTDLNTYKELFSLVDLIQVMSVFPGKGGQQFIESSLTNVAKANEAKKVNNKLIIEIDGGINDKNIPTLINKIDWFVTGSWFFKNIDHMGQYLEYFNNLIKQ